MRRKQKYGVVFIFLILNFQSTFGQGTVVCSDLASHLRGNQSVNVSAQKNWGRWVFGAGVDYMYNIAAQERRLHRSRLSYGLSGKFGFRLNRNGNSRFAHIIGVEIQQRKLNMIQLDADFGRSWTEKDFIFDKSYQKTVPLCIYQFDSFWKERFYISLKCGVGKSFIYDVTSVRIGRNTEFEEVEGFDFSDLGEHGYHRNEDGALDGIAFQLGISVGYLIFDE